MVSDHVLGLGVLLPTALATVFLYVGYVYMRNTYWHPLSRFPGPALARVSVYWKGYIECFKQGSLCHLFEELHKKYGTSTQTPSIAY